MIGVIADDLTGAAELAGIGLRYGLTAEVIVQGECNGKAELVCVDTDSRSCTANEAARRAAAAARELRKAGAAWIYKKVDSVLRGNVLAEAQAIQKALGLRGVLLAPANPCFGRVIRGGRYFVNGKPINQTDFARDPEYPRTSSNVLEMLGAAKTDAVSVCRLAMALPTSGIILGEVSSSADVEKWASRSTVEKLPAGGAEFFGALLNRVQRSGKSSGFPKRSEITLKRKRGETKARELFVCGSTSDYTEQFVGEARSMGTPVFSLIRSNGKNYSYSPTMVEAVAEQAMLAFESHSRVVVAVGRPLIERRGIARRLTRSLVKIAVLVMARVKPEHVYAEGGATAAELVRQLGWRRMAVLNELAPGVITLSLAGRKSVVLTIKPGSYPGWPKSE